MTVLNVETLHAGYEGIPVLNGVTFELGENAVLAILGRNGVGKTTLMRTLMGLLRPTGGHVWLESRDIARLPAYRIARLGLGYVAQGRGILPKLTVEENLRVGTRAQGRRSAEIPGELFDYFPILKERLRQRGGTLSGGEQQQLAIGRALCGRPRVLLLDEPAEGLQPNIVQHIAEIIPEIARGGVSVLLVEQNIDLVERAAPQCLIMEKGAIVHRCRSDEIATSASIKDLLAL